MEEILNRYENMLSRFSAVCMPEPGTTQEHLKWMLQEMRNIDDVEKKMRWLGFVQGCLIMLGYTTVNEERDFTRPYFRKD